MTQRLKKKTGNGNGAHHTQEKESILKIIKPRTKNQAEYLDSIYQNQLVLCTGPAGSGKTMLAAYAAAKALFDGKVKKIILTKPILEAGEQLGFLPGDILEKVDPHLKSLYDCLEKCIPRPLVKQLLEIGDIEVCPLAYMRGRSELLTSLIMTPNGYIKMGDVKSGDIISGSDGKNQKVQAIYPQGKLQVYKIIFSDHSEVECSAERRVH